MAQELERIVRVVGKEGRITQRAALSEVSILSDAIGCINILIEDLLRLRVKWRGSSVRSAKGNLSETVATEIEGAAAQRRVLAHPPDCKRNGGAA